MIQKSDPRNLSNKPIIIPTVLGFFFPPLFFSNFRCIQVYIWQPEYILKWWLVQFCVVTQGQLQKGQAESWRLWGRGETSQPYILLCEGSHTVQGKGPWREPAQAKLQQMSAPGQLLQQASDANTGGDQLHSKVSVLHPCWWLRDYKSRNLAQWERKGKKKKKLLSLKRTGIKRRVARLTVQWESRQRPSPTAGANMVEQGVLGPRSLSHHDLRLSPTSWCDQAADKPPFQIQISSGTRMSLSA